MVSVLLYGGSCEIRTHGPVTRSTVFKTAALNQLSQASKLHSQLYKEPVQLKKNPSRFARVFEVYDYTMTLCDRTP